MIYESGFNEKGDTFGGAIFSSDRKYRFLLWRQWASGKGVCFVMLNPSKAGATNDDPTVRVCKGFARRWGYAGIEVVNLYAYIATEPSDLWLDKGIDITGGSFGEMYLATVTRRAGMVLAAWGGNADPERAKRVLAGPLASRGIFCLGVTANGQPRHPSRLDGKTPPRPFWGIADGPDQVVDERRCWRCKALVPRGIQAMFVDGFVACVFCVRSMAEKATGAAVSEG